MAITVGTTLGTFEITGHLGAGGMGEVYLAYDSALGRKVAIKVLPEDFAKDGDRLARFRQEAQTLAALNHPNVATVHGFEHDEKENVHFLVMEHIDGESLADRVALQSLSLSDILDLFIQMAQGLDAAHEAGIVHRDLKPDNVHITNDGVVKIIDFGIAKQTGVSTPQTPDSPTTPMSPVAVTEEGTFLGTPVYMSPEQARGKTMDRRTDIWSYGCCLYEALTGDVPFRGETVADTVSKIIERDPDWSSLPDDTPREIRSLLRRCMEKDARKRFSSAGDMAYVLEEIRERQRRLEEEPAKTSASARSFSWTPVIAGVILAVAGIAGGFLWRGSDGTGEPGRGVGVPERGITSLAVLPFKNLMGDETKEYFVDGMTDTLTAELSKIASIKVIARTSAMKFKSTDESLSSIARTLNVDGLIEGSVQQFGDEVRITAQLIDGRSESHLWGENFEGTLAGVMKLQGTVAVAVAEQIGAVLTPAEREEYVTAKDVNPEAHDLYLRGRSMMKSYSQDDLRGAIGLFEEAVLVDPDFALAHAGIAEVYTNMHLLFFEAQDEYSEKAFRHARKAIELDDSLAAAHVSLGFAYSWFSHTRNWAEANRAFKRAVELDPGSANARTLYSLHLSFLGRNTDALREAKLATELDPLDAKALAFYGGVLYLAGHDEETEAVLLRASNMDPTLSLPSLYLSFLYCTRGRTDDALETAQKFSDLAGSEYAVFRLEFHSAMVEGDDALRALLAEIGEREVPGWVVPWIYLGLGDVDEALDSLEKILRSGKWDAMLSRTDAWNTIEPDPNDRRYLDDMLRFWEILDEYNLPPLPPEHHRYAKEQAWLREKAARAALAAQPKPVRRYVIQPETRIADEALYWLAIALSPDGKRIAYVDEGDDRQRMIFVRELDAFEARAIPGTEGAIMPIFAADGEALIYSDHTRSQIESVSIHGGTPQKITDADHFFGADWLADGSLVFAPSSDAPLMRIDKETGEHVNLLELDTESGESYQCWPQVLPNGDVLFTSVRGSIFDSQSQIELLSMHSMERRVLMEESAFARYVSPGYLVYQSERAMFAISFDATAGELQGEPVLLDFHPATHWGGPHFSVSDDGTLAYLPASGGRRHLAWVTDRGVSERIPAPPRAYGSVVLSHDGKEVLALLEENGFQKNSIWTYHLMRGTLTQLVSPGFANSLRLDDSLGFFFSGAIPEDGKYSIRRVVLDGSATPEREIFAVEIGDSDGSYDIHPGGKHLLYTDTLYTETIGGSYVHGIFSVDLSDPNQSEKMAADESSWQRGPRFSPTGDWFVYHSHETGTWEVYVMPFPGPGRKIPISTQGGYAPIWDPYRNKIYYRNGNEMWSVDYQLTPAFEPAPPKFLFEGVFAGGIDYEDAYDIAEDGRFIMIEKEIQEDSEIRIVENWFEELKRLAPAPEKN
jgi:serine/threonine protein kinase/tetratricopeptide (TPR) repeat protein